MSRASSLADGDLWRGVRARWRRAGVAPRHGASDEDIAQFERRFGVKLPEDVRTYFLAEDGTGQEMDDEHFRFWPLNEVKPVENELDESGGVVYLDRFAYPNYFVFADHLMNSWLYAVKLTTDPTQLAPVFRVTASDQPGEQKATTFREFMRRYADRPENIL